MSAIGNKMPAKLAFNTLFIMIPTKKIVNKIVKIFVSEKYPSL